MTQHSDLDHSEGSLPTRRQAVDVLRQTPSKTRLPTKQASTQNEGISPAFLWRVICQWWKWAVPVGLLLAAFTSYLVWYLHVPKYEAIALIEIQANRPYIAFENGFENRDKDEYVQTQIELLRSPVVLAPVLGLHEVALISEIVNAIDPLKYLQKHLEIEQIGQSALYELRYASPSAKDAATVANSVVQEYLRLQKQEESRRSKLVIDILEKERLDHSKRVEQLRQRVVDLAKEITGRDPFGQGAVTDIDRALSPVASLHQSLNDVEVKSGLLQAEIRALQDERTVFPEQARNSSQFDVDISSRAEVREMEDSRAEIEEKIAARRKAQLGSGAGLDLGDRDLQRLQQELKSIEAKLTAHKARLQRELQGRRVNELKAKREQLIATRVQELNSLNAQRALLAEKFDKNVAELKASGAQSAQLEFAKAELEREEKVFELIASRKLSLQTELEAPDRVSLRREASVPSLAEDPIPYKLLLIACLTSIVCPFALALAREMTFKRICDSMELASESMLPVLGEVSHFPVRPAATGHMALPARQQREMFIFAESIDSLRTNLTLAEDLGGEGQPRVIAIVSAASGEGKTSVASALAVSIAGATKKPTLVIDADLRSPDVAQVLGVPARPGLTEVFTGKASLDEAIHATKQTNTYVLPAGECRVNPHHVTQTSTIAELYDSLRAKFSTIIVDTPPILGASESLVYAKEADLVVLCSLRSVSRAKQVRSAVERLQTVGANAVGTVLSGIPIGRSSYSYGYSDGAGRVTELNS